MPDEYCKPESAEEHGAENTVGEVRYSTDKEFYNKFDAWDGVNPNITFVIGNTSEVLKSIGMKQELYAEKEGKRIPVLVSLELLPEKRLKVRDFAVITSAYAKKQLQYYIEENSILYIDPNKKRTNN